MVFKEKSTLVLEKKFHSHTFDLNKAIDIFYSLNNFYILLNFQCD